MRSTSNFQRSWRHFKADVRKDPWSALILALLVLAVLLAGISHVRAQQNDHRLGDHGYRHAEFHEWYKNLKRPDNEKLSCCSNEDCRPTRTRIRGEEVEAFINGKWYRIPPEKILKTPSPDLGSHVCAPQFSQYWQSEVSYPEGTIFCAIIGGGV